MFIILAIIIGLIIGAIRKGSVGNLFKNLPKLWYLGLLGALIQIFLHFAYYSPGLALGLLGTVLNFLSFILILVMFIFNFNNMWNIIAAVGVTICFVVIFINGGLMPISDGVFQALNNNALAQSISDELNVIYTMMSTGASTLWFLGIVVPIPFIAKITSIYGAVPGLSVGELLIFIGMFGWVQYAMTKGRIKAAEGVAVNPELEEEKVVVPTKKAKKKTLFDDDDDDDGIFADKEFTGVFLNKGDRDLLEEALREEQEADRLKAAAAEGAAHDLNEGTTEVIPDIDVQSMDLDQSEMDLFFNSDDTKEYRPSLRPIIDEDGLEDLLKKEPSSEESAEEPESEKAVETEEAVETAEGYFTQSFRADQKEQAEKSARSQKEWDPASSFFVRSNVGEPVAFEDTMTDYDETMIPNISASTERKTAFETPAWVMTSRPHRYSNYQQPPSYGVEAREVSAEPKKKVTEEEMLNVWKQVSDDIQGNKKARTRKYADGDNPFQIALAEQEKEEVIRQERAAAERAEALKREELALKWNAYKDSYFDNQEDTLPEEAIPEELPMDDQPAQVQQPKSAEDIEKERLGFEKIEIEVDGRTVSFWQRKK